MLPRVLLLLLALLGADVPEHDAHGFPVTINGEVLTRNDVFRALGVRPGALGGEGPQLDQQIRNARDLVLRRRLLERVGAIHGLRISDKEVRDEASRAMERRGGEAKFHEWLEQAGLTVAGFEEQLRFELLDGRIRELLVRGFNRDGKFLPYDVAWRPEEVGTAFARDARRRSGDGARARALELVLDLAPDERTRLVRRSMAQPDPDAWVKAELASACRKKLETARERLAAGTPFEELVKEAGGDPARGERWIDLGEGSGDDPKLAFLRTAAEGDVSEPIELEHGGFVLIKLLERKSEAARGLADPAVAQEYARRIQAARMEQARARMLLAALDDSYLEPGRVRQELRASILAELAQARRTLQDLGLK